MQARMPTPVLALAAMLFAVMGPARPAGSAPFDAVATVPSATPAQRHGAADPAAATLLLQAAQAWQAEAAEALRPLLAPGELRFRLDPPGAAGPTREGDAPVYSAAQVFYMLQNHFAAVRTVSASLERRVASAASDQAHGVLEVQWIADTHATATRRRLFVGLRRLGSEWRIVEVRALP